MKNPECILADFTGEELCSIYLTLNFWRWDERLGPKPDKWDRLPDFRRGLFKNVRPDKSKIISPYMDSIREKIGEKEILRYYHMYCKSGRKWTNEQFEEWWRNHCKEK